MTAVVGEFLRINTVVILLGGVIKGNPWVVLVEIEGCRVGKKFVGASGGRISRFFLTEFLSMEGKYTVKLTITDLFKFNRK